MSRVLRPVFIVLLALATLFTLVAFLTPGWKSYKGSGSPDFGLVTYTCGNGNRAVNYQDCWRWWNTRDPYVKATIALVAIALFLEIVALIWLIFTFCAFCSRHHLPIIPILVIAVLLLLIALIVYGVGVNSGNTEYMLSTTYEMNANVRLGYSWYLLLVALLLLLAATLVSAVFSHRQAMVDREEVS